MASGDISVVTGAFSFTGRYITERLLAQGETVRTITSRPSDADLFEQEIQTFPYRFDNWRAMTESLKGAKTFYNTYWIRFPYDGITFNDAVENSKRLIDAAQDAGVQRIVHMSVTSASLDSRFPYFAGKAAVEEAVQRSGMSWGIVRPTILFGPDDIMINNIVWHLRSFPLFAIFGDGQYQLQPVYVEDVADLAVQMGQQQKNDIVDAAGPDTFTFDEMVHLLADKLQSSARIIHLSAAKAIWLTRLTGSMHHDVVITRDEVESLMDNLLVSHNAATGKVSLGDYISQNIDLVGIQYNSEVKRHYKPARAA